jgi:hypothetical protein
VKKKLLGKVTPLHVTLPVEKSEPQSSICMGFPGMEGSYGKTTFESTIDMGGRGIIVSYRKGNGIRGSFKINVKDLIQACFDASTKGKRNASDRARG